jgi:glyoxylase-like metal-dependent hydrolase (beta-lactamase superfamily II)
MKIRALSTAFAAALVLAAPASAQSKLKPVKVVDGVGPCSPRRARTRAGSSWVTGRGRRPGADGQRRRDPQGHRRDDGRQPVRTLILTHAHADHSGGARAFAAAGARIVCQEGVAGQILAFVTQATSDPNDPMYGKSSLRPVVESISERAIFVDGLHNVQVYFLGAAHTKGDLVVYLANDKVLFSGDIALNGRMPSCSRPTWIPRAGRRRC